MTWTLESEETHFQSLSERDHPRSEPKPASNDSDSLRGRGIHRLETSSLAVDSSIKRASSIVAKVVFSISISDSEPLPSVTALRRAATFSSPASSNVARILLSKWLKTCMRNPLFVNYYRAVPILDRARNDICSTSHSQISRQVHHDKAFFQGSAFCRRLFLQRLSAQFFNRPQRHDAKTHLLRNRKGRQK